MGLEWESEIPIKKTVLLPMTGLSEYYKKEGYKISSVSLKRKVIGKHNRNDEIENQKLLKENPNAILERINPNSSLFQYVSPADVIGLIVELTSIEKDIN